MKRDFNNYEASQVIFHQPFAFKMPNLGIRAKGTEITLEKETDRLTVIQSDRRIRERVKAIKK
ncbi:hypothetical protein BEP19_13120 [Ammoniphilus oxalaticus]|uniref:Uncharacterized protein n=1 Tax=Ammoniphilus oxalaticus TaxID=66863 RepID=A0A419SHA8_9BACL|nr:hypothetical protein BEP19_13120 [Ammoniphilus oxalaticus]